jgi:hypothetical protein
MTQYRLSSAPVFRRASAGCAQHAAAVKYAVTTVQPRQSGLSQCGCQPAMAIPNVIDDMLAFILHTRPVSRRGERAWRRIPLAESCPASSFEHKLELTLRNEQRRDDNLLCTK